MITDSEKSIYESILSDNIGSRIKRIRKFKGLTQAELGEKVGLNSNRIQQYENGARTPKVDMLVNIAKALDVNIRAITDPKINDFYGVMFALFDLEDFWGLEIKSIDNQLFLFFDDSKDENRAEVINSYLKYWYNSKQFFHLKTQHDVQLNNNFIGNTYEEFKWNFPQNYREFEVEENKDKLITDIKKQISELQNELLRLEKTKNDN